MCARLERLVSSGLSLLQGMLVLITLAVVTIMSFVVMLTSPALMMAMGKFLTRSVMSLMARPAVDRFESTAMNMVCLQLLVCVVLSVLRTLPGEGRSAAGTLAVKWLTILLAATLMLEWNALLEQPMRSDMPCMLRVVVKLVGMPAFALARTVTCRLPTCVFRAGRVMLCGVFCDCARRCSPHSAPKIRRVYTDNAQIRYEMVGLVGEGGGNTMSDEDGVCVSVCCTCEVYTTCTDETLRTESHSD